VLDSTGKMHAVKAEQKTARAVLLDWGFEFGAF